MIRHFFTPGLFINSYLVIDEETKRGVVIDPTRQIDLYCLSAKQEGIEITDIVETHVHADFISGAPELKAVLDGKPKIHCSGLGIAEWTPAYADHIVEHRDVFHLGGLRFEARHTPGHTSEHIIWVVYNEYRSKNLPEIAFTGDLLFVGGVGRPDLLGEELLETLTKQLYGSLYSEMHALPDYLEIYPAHGGGSLCGKSIGMKHTTTLGYEKRCNPWLVPQKYCKWHDSLQLDRLPIPSYFKRMKKINIKGWNQSTKKESLVLLTLKEFKQRPKGELVVDLRSPDDFAAGSIEGSLNIPFNPSLPLWAGTILPEDIDLMLIVNKQETIFLATQALGLVGLDHISGVLDSSKWNEADKQELSASATMSVEDLNLKMPDVFLLDVRNRHEWDAGHIEGAILIELTRFPKAANEVPSDKPIAVICHSGNRASIIASLLRKEKGLQVFNVRGGMQAWNKAKLPIVKLQYN